MAKPSKTFADYLVVSISPLLIMLLVGSLSFFLVEVFFRGEAIGSVRWVMFWFVMAVVLVSRIGIEQGTEYASIYGLALALATWFYLMRIHPAFILGMILLGVVWWCANKLTWDCTLIDEDEDASGGGLLETAGDKKNFLPAKKEVKQARPQKGKKPKRAQPHAPGLWVVYFSLAALPLFGIGQMLLPGNDAARQAGFYYLFIYVTAALGLLLTTSFLGLRRYLRQRYLEMPPRIAFGWVRFGVVLAMFVLVGALLLPRPGGTQAWKTLSYHIDHQLRQASRFAMRFSPHGRGEGRAGNETENSEPTKKPTGAPQLQNGSEPAPTSGDSGEAQKPGGSAQANGADKAGDLYGLFKNVFLVVLVVVVVWWVFRKRELLAQGWRAFVAALKKFFHDLFNIGSWRKAGARAAKIQREKRNPFASYRNPFLAGDGSWSEEKLVLYSYEALRAWAEERGVKSRPEQTAREFCGELENQFPEITADLNQLSFLYGYAAYGTAALAGCDLESVKSLWRYFYSERA